MQFYTHHRSDAEYELAERQAESHESFSLTGDMMADPNGVRKSTTLPSSKDARIAVTEIFVL